MYSDFNLFKCKKLEEEYKTFLHTGLARRCMFVFYAQNKLQEDTLNLQRKNELEQNIKTAGENLMEVFLVTTKINDNGSRKIIYKYTEKALEELQEYTNNCIRLYNETEDEMLQLEIKSRELKVLKLACLYAWINHYDYIAVTDNDVLQAISTVEYFSSGLQQFLSYNIKQPDKYEDVFQFLQDNLGTRYNKTELCKICMNKFGFSRREFINEFNELMNYIEEMAYSKEYRLHSEEINKNRGKTYWLSKYSAGLF